MNETLTIQVAAGLSADLRVFTGICEEIFSLARSEHQALAGPGGYEQRAFDRRRSELLPDIESLVRNFRSHRAAWCQIPQAQRERFEELKQLFQKIQNLLMRVLVLDRENQQAMLKRGLVPAQHIPAVAAKQPNYIANVYRKNSLSGK
ncbi:MAG TPA: hypothetical protein VGY98_01895 [Verrucomicrobiae bacterium]|nr:hypothetical protein [Verrucomicrobiae bacterium]